MSDDLKDVGLLVKEGDELSLGRGGEGAEKLVLRKSELQVLRRMADRFPSTADERRRAMDLTMHVMDGDYSPGHKLTALRVFATFEKLNVEEMKTYIAAKIAVMPKTAEKPMVNVNIDARKITVEGVLDEYANVIENGDVPSQSAQDDHFGKSIHSGESGKAQSNGKAS